MQAWGLGEGGGEGGGGGGGEEGGGGERKMKIKEPGLGEEK